MTDVRQGSCLNNLTINVLHLLKELLQINYLFNYLKNAVIYQKILTSILLIIM